MSHRRSYPRQPEGSKIGTFSSEGTDSLWSCTGVSVFAQGKTEKVLPSSVAHPLKKLIVYIQVRFPESYLQF